MHKFITVLLVLFVPLIVSGCGSDVEGLIKSNMAEITQTYYAGEVELDRASISVGKREEPYIKDGICGKSVSFSLVTLSLGSEFFDLRLPATLTIDGKSEQILLELVSNIYMFDLEKSINTDQDITLSYLDKTMTLTRQEFAVDSASALKTASVKLHNTLDDYISRNKLSGECYLKVLGRVDENYDDYFWAFTFIGRDGKVINLVMDVTSGEVVGEK